MRRDRHPGQLAVPMKGWLDRRRADSPRRSHVSSHDTGSNWRGLRFETRTGSPAVMGVFAVRPVALRPRLSARLPFIAARTVTEAISPRKCRRSATSDSPAGFSLADQPVDDGGANRVTKKNDPASGG